MMPYIFRKNKKKETKISTDFPFENLFRVTAVESIFMHILSFPLSVWLSVNVANQISLFYLVFNFFLNRKDEMDRRNTKKTKTKTKSQFLKIKKMSFFF
jgi:hypothetical protein